MENLYKELDRVEILGVRIDNVPLETVINTIICYCSEDKKGIIANLNIHAINLACEIPWFRSFFSKAVIVFCDGFGIMAGAFLLGKRITYRYTPPDWIDLLCEKCVEHNLSLFFLGARDGIAQRASLILTDKHPGLKIVGSHHGYFDKNKGSFENEKVVQEINQIKPNIIILGFGMPMQEQWLVENFEGLNVNIALPGGALFDYISGEVIRAPRWLTDHGLEWLGRLVIEPRRLWKRYLLGNPLFFIRVLAQRIGLYKFS